MSPVSTDEIFERYLQKAITEINELADEIAHAAGESQFPVVGSGHPMADIFLLKYGPQASEAQEGVSFYGRAGQAIIKSLQRLNVDPLAVYGTNCLKFASQKPEQARSMLTRELHIVQPKLIVAMGDDTLRFLNALDFPLADPVEPRPGRDPALHADDRRARRAGHRRLSRRAGTEDGVLERLQGSRPVVGGATPVLTRRRLAALGVLAAVLAVYFVGHESLPDSSTWWDVAFIAVLVIPVVFAPVLLLLPLSDWRWRWLAIVVCVAFAIVFSVARLGGAGVVLEARRGDLRGLALPRLLRGGVVGRRRRADHPVGRRVLGLARPDAHDRHAPRGRLRAPLVRVPRSR